MPGKQYPTSVPDLGDNPARIVDLEGADTANAVEFETIKLTVANPAAAEAVEAVATSDTPAVTWITSANGPSGDPDGYLKILVGATPYYLPFWA